MKTSILVGAAGLALSGAAFAGPWDAYPTEVREALENGAISPYQLTWMPQTLFEKAGYVSVPVTGNYNQAPVSPAPLSFGGTEGTGGPFPESVFFIDQFTGSPVGQTQGTYNFADFTNGIGGNPVGQTWEDQFNPTGTPILTFGGSNHVGVGDATVITAMGADGSPPATGGAPWSNGGPPWLINAAGSQGRNIFTGQFAGDLSFISQDLFPSRASTGDDAWVYTDVYRTALERTMEFAPANFTTGVQFADRIFMGGTDFFGFSDPDGILRVLVNLSPLAGISGFATIVAQENDPNGAANVPQDEWFSVAWHGSSSGPGTGGVSVWIKTQTAVTQQWLDPRMAAGDLIPPDGDPFGWINTAPGLGASAPGVDEDGAMGDPDGFPDGMPLATDPDGNIASNAQDLGQAPVVNAFLINSYHLGSGSFDPADAQTFSDMFWDNNIMDGTPIVQPCPVTDFSLMPSGFSDDLELWDPLLPLRFQGGRFFVGSTGNAIINDFTFGSQTIQEQNETQSSVYDTGAVSMELPPEPARDQLNPQLGPDGVLFSADDDPVVFSGKFTVTSNPGQTGLSLVLTDDSVLGGGRESIEIHFGVDDPLTGIAQGEGGVGPHIWVRQPNVGSDGVYGDPPGFDQNANIQNNLVAPNWVPSVEGLSPVLDALNPPFNVSEENIPASADGASKAVLPFNSLTEVEVRLLPNPNEDPDNPIDEGVAQIFLNGVKLIPAPGLIQNTVGTFQGFVAPGVDAAGDDVWFSESPFPGEYAIGKHNNAAGAGDNAFIDDFFLNGPTLSETRVDGPAFAVPYEDDFETDENGDPTYPVDRPIAGQGSTGVLNLASVPDTRTFNQNSLPTTLAPLTSPTTVDGDNVCRYLINETKIDVSGIAVGDVLAVNHDDLPDPFNTVNADNTDCPGQQGNRVQYMVRDDTGLRIGQGFWTLLEQEPITFNGSSEVSTITLPADATMGADGGWAVTITSLETDSMGNPIFAADALVGTDPAAPLAVNTTSAAVLDAVQTQLDADLAGSGCTTSRVTSGGEEQLIITCASGDIVLCSVQGFSDPIDTDDPADGVNDAFEFSAGPLDIANETLDFNGFIWNKLVAGGGDTNFAYRFLDLSRWGGDADQVMVRDLTSTPQEGASGHGQALCIRINNGVDGFPNFGNDQVLTGVLPEAVAREASGGQPATTARLEVSLFIESLDINGMPVNQPPRDRFELDFTGGRGNAGLIASVNFGGPNVNANTNLQDAGINELAPDAIGVSRDSGITTPEVQLIDSGVSLTSGGMGLGSLVNKWIRFAFEVDPDGTYRMFLDDDADDGVDNFVQIDESTAIDQGQIGTGGIPVNVSSLDDLNIDVGNSLGSGGEAALDAFRIRLLEDFDVTTLFDMNGDPVTDSNGNGLADELELAASVSADLDADGQVGDTNDDNTDGFNDDAAPSDGGTNGRERSSLDWCIYSAAGLENFQADEVAPLVYRVDGQTGEIDPTEGLRTWQPLEDNFIAVLNKRRNGGAGNNTDGFLIGDGDGADEVIHDPCPIDPVAPDEVEIFDANGNLMADTRWGLTGQAGLAGQLNPIPDGGIRLAGPRNVVGADGLIGTMDDNPDEETDGDGNVVGNGFPDGVAAYNDPTFFANDDVFPAPGPVYEAILLATWVDDADDGVDPFPVAPPNQQWYVDDLVLEEVAGALACPGNLNTDSTALCPDGVTEAQVVNGADLGNLLLAWSPADNSVGPDNPADLNGDLKVDGGDLGLLLLAFGLCPGECQ